MLSLSIFLFSKRRTEEKKHRAKQNGEKGGSFPSSSCYALSRLAPISTLLFQTLFPSIFFFSSRRKEKKT
jgi:hypothetical protein